MDSRTSRETAIRAASAQAPDPAGDLDRTSRAQLARATSGISQIGTHLAFADWMAHLAISPGKQMSLALGMAEDGAGLAAKCNQRTGLQALQADDAAAVERAAHVAVAERAVDGVPEAAAGEPADAFAVAVDRLAPEHHDFFRADTAG